MMPGASLNASFLGAYAGGAGEPGVDLAIGRDRPPAMVDWGGPQARRSVFSGIISNSATSSTSISPICSTIMRWTSAYAGDNCSMSRRSRMPASSCSAARGRPRGVKPVVVVKIRAGLAQGAKGGCEPTPARLAGVGCGLRRGISAAPGVPGRVSDLREIGSIAPKRLGRVGPTAGEKRLALSHQWGRHRGCSPSIRLGRARRNPGPPIAPRDPREGSNAVVAANLVGNRIPSTSSVDGGRWPRYAAAPRNIAVGPPVNDAILVMNVQDRESRRADEIANDTHRSDRQISRNSIAARRKTRAGGLGRRRAERSSRH